MGSNTRDMVEETSRISSNSEFVLVLDKNERIVILSAQYGYHREIH